MEILVKHLTSHEIECGICGVTDNQDNPDDRKAVPFLNGEPTTSDGECDGYCMREVLQPMGRRGRAAGSAAH